MFNEQEFSKRKIVESQTVEIVDGEATNFAEDPDVKEEEERNGDDVQDVDIPNLDEYPYVVNDQWSMKALSSLLYDFKTGLAHSKKIQKKNLEIFRQYPQRKYNVDEWINPGPEVNPETAELSIAFGAIVEQWNEDRFPSVNVESAETAGTPERTDAPKHANMFDLSAASVGEKMLTTPSGFSFRVSEALSQHSQWRLRSKNLEAVTKIITLDVMRLIAGRDKYFTAYTPSLTTARCKFWPIGFGIAEAIELFVKKGSGLAGYFVHNKRGIKTRLVCLILASMDNYITRRRHDLDAKRPGRTQVLLKELKYYIEKGKLPTPHQISSEDMSEAASASTSNDVHLEIEETTESEDDH